MERPRAAVWPSAFYANVELKHRPELRGKPMAVGGMAMLSTANYEARYGPSHNVPRRGGHQVTATA